MATQMARVAAASGCVAVDVPARQRAPESPRAAAERSRTSPQRQQNRPQPARARKESSRRRRWETALEVAASARGGSAAWEGPAGASPLRSAWGRLRGPRSASQRGPPRQSARAAPAWKWMQRRDSRVSSRRSGGSVRAECERARARERERRPQRRAEGAHVDCERRWTATNQIRTPPECVSTIPTIDLVLILKQNPTSHRRTSVASPRQSPPNKSVRRVAWRFGVCRALARTRLWWERSRRGGSRADSDGGRAGSPCAGAGGSLAAARLRLGE